MAGAIFDTPVALFSFNRPQFTKQVVDTLREIQPSRVLLICDGPRLHRENDKELCAQVLRELNNINWPCHISRNFSPRNLGCGLRMSTGLDWVFRSVEEAIILEDDCLPSPDFFTYCAEMLVRYQNEARVGFINGTNLGHGRVMLRESYGFSRYFAAWGWAAWRRSWKEYDFGLSDLSSPDVRQKILCNLDSEKLSSYFDEIFCKVQTGEIDTWDYQVSHLCFKKGFLNVVPAQNLISNIGFGPDATHTKNASHFSGLPHGALQLPLKHPKGIERSDALDEYIEKHAFGS